MSLTFEGSNGGGWDGTNYTVETDPTNIGWMFIVFLLVATSYNATTSDFSVSDTSDNTYYILELPEWNFGYDAFVCWGVIPNPAPNDLVITPIGPLAGINVSAYMDWEFWSGMGTITLADQSAAENDAAAPGAVTTQYPNEFIWTTSIAGGGIDDIPEGYVAGLNNTASSVYSAGLILGSPGSVNPTWGESTDYVAVVTFGTPPAPSGPQPDGATGQAFFRRRNGPKWSPWMTRKSGLIVPNFRGDIGTSIILP